MTTRFTQITPKDLQRLQGTSSYEQARRDLVAIKDSYSAKVAVVWHLAQYLGVPENEIITSLK